MLIPVNRCCFSNILSIYQMIKSMKSTPNIYILEDNADIGFILEVVLTEEGFNIHLYNCVSDLQAAVRKDLPDLFLLDVMLPDGNGIEMCHLIKTTTESSKLPVLMMSANTEAESVMECNAEAFIQKPFDLDVVVNTIKAHLRAA